MDTDLRDDLDRCFGDGPPVDDTDLLLDRGRTALRRRRLVEGMLALAVTAVVVVGALAASGSGPAASPDHPPVASSPAAVATASVSFTIVTDPALAETRAQGPVELTPSHQLRVAPGVELQRIVVDPYDPAVYPATAALVYRWEGKTYWHLLYALSDGTTSGATTRASDDGDFDAWLADQVQHPSSPAASVVVDPGLPAEDPVMVDSKAGLHAAPGVRIVRIVTNPFERVAPAASTAVIYVRDGEAYWFVASTSDTGGAGATTPAGRGDRTFDEWVADHDDMPETPADPEGGLR
jgi:hypothetical protein